LEIILILTIEYQALKIMDMHIERRDFLKKAALITAGFLSVSSASNAFSMNNKKLNSIPLLNPAFNVNMYENGELEIYTFLKDKSKLSEIFVNFEADIIIEVLHHRDPFDEYPSLALKYNMSKAKSKKKIDRLLTDLEKSGIVFYGDQILVKITGENKL
jgi:hypothetical protein